MYKLFIRKLLFRFEAESVHRFAAEVLELLLSIGLLRYLFTLLFFRTGKGLGKEVFGVYFPNPVGLAAGFDKNADIAGRWGCLGFGFAEIGTVTPRPQPGNPKPRLFRLPLDNSLINRMGFNNRGAESAALRLKGQGKTHIPVGANLGKNKDTPNEEAASDYLACLHALHPYADYLVVNVSSPNTPGLRELQDKEPLAALLNNLQQANNAYPKPRPLLLKIAPDLTNSQLDDIIALVQETKLAGVIAGNTTLSRAGLQTSPETVQAIGSGGLSGQALHLRALEVVRYLHTQSGGAFPIIGAGGISSPAHALEMLEAGAALVQLYTGFIYEGPGLIRRICKAVQRKANAQLSQ